MKIAVNYSTASCDLFQAGRIPIDLFKCFMQADVVTVVQKFAPLYIHFPLKVGAGIGDGVDTITHQPANWAMVECFLAHTHTPFINLHLAQACADFPHLPPDTLRPDHVAMLTEYLLTDVQAVVKRFGAERVIVENDHHFGGRHLRPASLPHVIRQITEETGCGFLLDVAHARLAALNFGIEAQSYLTALPVRKLREIHVSGVQRFEGAWLEKLRNAAPELADDFTDEVLDHFPLTDEDWQLTEWSFQNIREGNWQRPGMVTMECGGLGPMWEAMSSPGMLEEQLCQLHRMVKTTFG
jgi:uncharacterized protein